MTRDTLGILFASCAVVVAVVGISPIMDALYRVGLFPAVTQNEVEQWLRRQHPNATFTCQPGTGGWEYICDAEYVQRGGYTSRHRHGIIGSWQSPVASISELPRGGPIPSRDEYLQRLDEQARLPTTINLNAARLDQLKALPGIDEALAIRIQRTGFSTPFTSVDDVLKVEGMTPEKLERIRPLVHVKTDPAAGKP